MKKHNQINNTSWLSNISENNMWVRCTFGLLCLTKFLQIARCAAPFLWTEFPNICSIRYQLSSLGAAHRNIQLYSLKNESELIPNSG